MLFRCDTMIEYKQYDKSYEAEVLEVFLEAFRYYPLFYGIFEGTFKTEQKLQSFYEQSLTSIFRATIRKDRCYIGFLDGRVVDVVILEAPTDKPIGFFDYLVSGMPGIFLKLGLKKTFQYLDLSERTEVVVKSIKEPRWHLYFLAVSPKHQKEGLGTDAIRNFVIPMVKENNGNLITVTTNSEKNVKFYQDNGFTLVEEERLDFNGKVFGNWTFRMDLKE